MTGVYILFGLWFGTAMYFMTSPVISVIMGWKPMSHKVDLKDHRWVVGLISIVLFFAMFIYRFNFVG